MSNFLQGLTVIVVALLEVIVEILACLRPQIFLFIRFVVGGLLMRRLHTVLLKPFRYRCKAAAALGPKQISLPTIIARGKRNSSENLTKEVCFLISAYCGYGCFELQYDL